MGFWEIIGLIVTGAIIGALARLIVPGKQSIGIIVTILLGIVGALIGGFIASALGAGTVVYYLIAVVLAAALVAVVGGTAKRGARV